MKKTRFMFYKNWRVTFYVIVLWFASSSVAWAQIEGGLLVGIHSVANTTEMNAIVNPEIGSLVFNTADDIKYVFNGTIWVSSSLAHVPYISNVSSVEVNQSLTEKVIIEGSNFTIATTLTIPNFSGTFTYTVLSDTQIELNVIRPTTVGVFDIVLENNGVKNSLWPNNEVGKLEVIKSDGTSAKNAGRTCKAIYDDGYAVGDQNYWINPTEGDESDAFEARCDMTNGGWTAVEYTYDLPLKHQYYSTADGRRWLNRNFYLKLSDVQINAIRNASTEAKQNYVGRCTRTIHYRYKTGYGSAFGFRFHTGYESNYGSATYTDDITVSNDGCASNNATTTFTTFVINDLRLPLINILSNDNGGYNELFGSNLTKHPAWFK